VYVASWPENQNENFGILLRPTIGDGGTLRSLMPCLLVILLLAFPRIALALLFFFSNYLERAYHGLILPLLGFVFLPLTTLAYAWMVNTRQPLEGINLLILVVAIVIDVVGLGGGEHHRRRRLQD
jgi:hypothetical protein